MLAIPTTELKFIGALLADKLQSDKEFREFIERRIAVQKKETARSGPVKK